VEPHQTTWNPVLRQAVIRIKPDYFALTETRREHYRPNLNTEDDFRIRQTVIKELFGMAVNTTEELDAVRFRYFVRDCRRIAGNPAEVDRLV